MHAVVARKAFAKVIKWTVSGHLWKVRKKKIRDQDGDAEIKTDRNREIEVKRNTNIGRDCRRNRKFALVGRQRGAIKTNRRIDRERERETERQSF